MKSNRRASSLRGLVLLLLVGCSANNSITPAPIDIGPQEKVVLSEKKLVVRNNRAALYVLLAHISKQQSGEIIMSGMNYPIAESIHAEVCAGDGQTCTGLHYAGISLDETSVEGIYTADWKHIQEVPDFASVRIKSDRDVRGVELTWKSMRY